MKTLKFKPLKKEKALKPLREVLTLHIPPALSEQLKKAVSKSDLSKQELVRQMIEKCCKDMEK